MTIVIVIPAISLNMAYLGPALAMMQSLVRPNMRATASAVVFFIGNLIGLGMPVYPEIVGRISDIIAPTYGAWSLSVGLSILAAISKWAAVHFCWPLSHFISDLMRPNRRDLEQFNIVMWFDC